MGKNLKELISKRNELSYEASRVNSEVAELLAQPCYDVLGLYENENPFFMTRGMSSKEILSRLYKIVGVKNYDGVDSGLIDSLKVSDIDGALDYLFDKGKKMEKYEISDNPCFYRRCHPETCCCADDELLVIENVFNDNRVFQYSKIVQPVYFSLLKKKDELERKVAELKWKNSLNRCLDERGNNGGKAERKYNPMLDEDEGSLFDDDFNDQCDL